MSGTLDLTFDKNTSKLFPLRELKYEQLPQKNKQMIKKMLYLFVFYASKGSKHCYYQLQAHYFMQLMKDLMSVMGIQQNKTRQQQKALQMIYYSKGFQNTLSFKNFLQLLPYLSLYFQSQDTKSSRQQSLKNFILLLQKTYQLKVVPQILGNLVQIQLNIEDNTKQFIKKLSASLIKLYKIYFPHELLAFKIKNIKQKSLYKQRSLKCYMQFLQQFEIYPKLLSARDIFYIFFQSCQKQHNKQTNKNKIIQSQFGQIYKFSLFIQSLIIISKRIFLKLKQVQNQQQFQHSQQKILIRTLLQYMQAVKTTNRKKTKFNNQKLCFIVLDQHPQQILFKTIQIKDKIIKQSIENLQFFTLMDKLTF